MDSARGRAELVTYESAQADDLTNSRKHHRVQINRIEEGEVPIVSSAALEHPHRAATAAEGHPVRTCEESRQSPPEKKAPIGGLI